MLHCVISVTVTIKILCTILLFRERVTKQCTRVWAEDGQVPFTTNDAMCWHGEDWSKQGDVLTHLITWYNESNFIVQEISGGKNAKNICKLKILKLHSSNLASHWCHLESFKIYWTPSAVPSDSDLMGVRCRLEFGILKVHQVFLTCSWVGKTYSRWCQSFHPKTQ